MIDVDDSIRVLADDLASQYESPIPLLRLADDELIKIICDDYGPTSFDGLTWYEPLSDDFFIHLNTNPNRKNTVYNRKGRFTLAHELGHYFIPTHRLGLMKGELKPHGSLSYLNDLPAWRLEREADAFASSLLMPSMEFQAFIRGKRFSFRLIEDIADKFQVSKSAAAIRFARIGNYPIMVVFAVSGRLRWVTRSRDFPFMRLRNGSGRGDKVPENTVMGTYFFENDNSDCQQAETVYAQDCFETRYVDDNMREFYEWCIEYKDSSLSVFWEK